MTTVDLRAEIREFLSTRRGRITPEQAGLFHTPIGGHPWVIRSALPRP